MAIGSWADAAWSAAVEFRHMQRTTSPSVTPPGDRDGLVSWVDVRLPDSVAPSDSSSGTLWYRGDFDWTPDADSRAQWAVCLPFLYEGGEIWINGMLAGSVPEGSPTVQVRWERPHLITVPAGLLRPGRNQIAIRAGASTDQTIQHFPRVLVGLESELRPRADRRTFWVRTMPQVTVVVCLLVSGFVLFIYWRRRSEVLYGLFGLASALWGVRTMTFIVERMTTESWNLWRIAYHCATGGFIVVLALFAMRLAGIFWPRAEKILVFYWLAGPLWLWWAGSGDEVMVNRIWTAGLIPIGLAILWVSAWAMWRQRTMAAAIMPVTLAIAVLTGVHDYALAWNPGALAHFLPEAWIGQRIFLLHYGANLVLLGMGGLLTNRFIQALSSLELANGSLAELNETLESRVAQRERRLAENFARMAELQREHAAAHERQLIMREIHDGLGSRLFTSLLRVERGDMSGTQIAEALRDCIADMRLSLEVLAPDDDFQAALGNFLFRWQTQMREAQVMPSWSIDVPEGGLNLSRQTALQLLRITQEALTNVLKHAGAKNVRIDLRQRGDRLELEVADDGRGADFSEQRPGRGMGNMRARAKQSGGELSVRSGPGGTRLFLYLPLAKRSTDPMPASTGERPIP